MQKHRTYIMPKTTLVHLFVLGVVWITHVGQVASSSNPFQRDSAANAAVPPHAVGARAVNSTAQRPHPNPANPAAAQWAVPNEQVDSSGPPVMPAGRPPFRRHGPRPDTSLCAWCYMNLKGNECTWECCSKCCKWMRYSSGARGCRQHLLLDRAGSA